MNASPRIAFVHIQKTGGTTATNWIQRHFDASEISFDAGSWEKLAGYSVETLAAKRFIRGHYGSALAWLLPAPLEFHLITLMRDPVERVMSHYWHVLRAPGRPTERIRNALGGEFSIEQFVESDISRPLVGNFQTACLGFDLTGGPPPIPPPKARVADPGRAALTHAINFLERCSVVGILERHDEFLVDMCETFGFCPDRSIQRARSYHGNSAADVTGTIRKKIIDLNDLDYALYEGALHRANRISRRPVSVFTRPAPHEIYIDASREAVTRWTAGQRFQGNGWSDMQSAMDPDVEIHRWAVPGTGSQLLVRVDPNEPYLVIVELLRFVAPEQAGSFKIATDTQALTSRQVSAPVGRQTNDAPIFLARMMPEGRDNVSLSLSISDPMSFSEIDPNSDDGTKRGFALVAVTFVNALQICGEPSRILDECLRNIADLCKLGETQTLSIELGRLEGQIRHDETSAGR